jgi:hypothetical protein
LIETGFEALQNLDVFWYASRSGPDAEGDDAFDGGGAGRFGGDRVYLAQNGGSHFCYRNFWNWGWGFGDHLPRSDGGFAGRFGALLPGHRGPGPRVGGGILRDGDGHRQRRGATLAIRQPTQEADGQPEQNRQADYPTDPAAPPGVPAWRAGRRDRRKGGVQGVPRGRDHLPAEGIAVGRLFRHGGADYLHGGRRQAGPQEGRGGGLLVGNLMNRGIGGERTLSATAATASENWSARPSSASARICAGAM